METIGFFTMEGAEPLGTDLIALHFLRIGAACDRSTLRAANGHRHRRAFSHPPDRHPRTDGLRIWSWSVNARVGVIPIFLHSTRPASPDFWKTPLDR